MSALPMPRPADGPPFVPPDAGIDLDTRIGAVEGRLMAREQRIGDQVRQLGARAGRLAAPRLLLLKLGGAAVAGGGLVWALRRGSRPLRPHAAEASPTGPADGPAAGMPPWVMPLLPLAWPLLPARWRMRISPATAATVLGLAVPLAQQLLRRPPKGHAGVPPACSC